MKAIYQKAIEAWGEGAQVNMAIEEMLELSYALMKLIRNPDSLVRKQSVEEEIADVEIMMKQLRYIFDEEIINKYKRQKLARLMNLIEQDKREQL